MVLHQSSDPVPEGKQSGRALSQTKSRRQWASVIICGRQQIQSLSADTEREGGRQDPEANGFSSAEEALLSSITETLRTWRYVMHETYEGPEDNKDD